MGGNTPGENFLAGNFPGGVFVGGVWWVRIFQVGISPGEFFYNHFLHIIYLFLFLKKISINIVRLSTKRYILSTHKISRRISFPQLFVLISAKYFQHKARKAMEVLSSEQVRGPRKT